MKICKMMVNQNIMDHLIALFYFPKGTWCRWKSHVRAEGSKSQRIDKNKTLIKIKNSKHFTSLFRQWNEQTAQEEIFPKSPKLLLYDAQLFMVHLFLYKELLSWYLKFSIHDET